MTFFKWDMFIFRAKTKVWNSVSPQDPLNHFSNNTMDCSIKICYFCEPWNCIISMLPDLILYSSFHWLREISSTRTKDELLTQGNKPNATVCLRISNILTNKADDISLWILAEFNTCNKIATISCYLLSQFLNGGSYIKSQMMLPELFIVFPKLGTLDAYNHGDVNDWAWRPFIITLDFQTSIKWLVPSLSTFLCPFHLVSQTTICTWYLWFSNSSPWL